MPKNKDLNSPALIRKSPKILQTENDIFALDIGTRNVVGVIGHVDDGVFVVTEAVSVAHKRRAMLDGQIEDINETARVVRRVKAELEEKTGMSLTRVAIAAAGRALRTKRASLENELDTKESITETMLKTLELEAVSKAQSELDKENNEEGLTFYCVGHTVIKYKLDDYPIKSLLGHKGKKVAVELIAAFLPSLVVESLYTVMDMNNLDVCSLTLEPIAAMNVIIPPEVRLINIALVDIGAGTTDIAVSQNGSIVAYAMATIAGDEITEEIIRNYLVDFETAEEMKLTPLGEDVNFVDILGFAHTIDSQEFFTNLFPAIDQLAATIADNILEANGSAPAAVFLVGGGSLIPELTELVSEKLEIPQNRVAIGGHTYNKNIDLDSVETVGPEYVTPIGIGITATLQTGYEFSQVTLNGTKIRIFDTKAVTAAELLMNAGFKTAQIIGKSGRGLVFNLNGEKQSIRGETSSPAQIMVNNLPAALEYTIKQGDVIDFTPATIGMNAAVTISDIAGDIFSKKIIIDGDEYSFGRTVRVNGNVVSGNYSVQNYDNIEIETIETLDELIMSLPFDCSRISFYKGERLLRGDYTLEENDSFTTRDKKPVQGGAPNMAREAAARGEKASRTVEMLSGISAQRPEAPSAPQNAPSITATSSRPAPSITASGAYSRPAPSITASSSRPSRPVISTPLTRPAASMARPASSAASALAAMPEPETVLQEEPKMQEFAPVEQQDAPGENAARKSDDISMAIPMGTSRSISVMLNDKSVTLNENKDGSPHEFLELMALADIDTSNPPTSGNMVLTLNGHNASFMDLLHSGDRVVIKWEN